MHGTPFLERTCKTTKPIKNSRATFGEARLSGNYYSKNNMLEELKAKDYESLSVEERIIVTTSTNLIKHFKGMESAGLLDSEKTSKFIGSVKKLAAIACGITNPTGSKGYEEHSTKKPLD